MAPMYILPVLDCGWLFGKECIFLTYVSFRKCHLSKRTLVLVCLIPLPLCCWCNSRTTAGHPSWLAACPRAHRHRSTDLLPCALRHPTKTTSFTTHPDNEKRCYIWLFLCLSLIFCLKKTQNAVRISNSTLQCFSYGFRILYLSSRVDTFVPFSLPRRRSWSSCCWCEVWAPLSQWRYRDRRLTIISHHHFHSWERRGTPVSWSRARMKLV